VGNDAYPGQIGRLENVPEGRYFPVDARYAMNAPRRTKAMIGKAEGRRFWRWPLALSLVLAMAISLFHDLPAFAGRGDFNPTSVTVSTSIGVPVQAPDSQAPGHGWSLPLPYDSPSYCESDRQSCCFQRAPLSPSTRHARALLCRAPPLPSPPRLKPAPRTR
jgi:hypothetical protein